MILGNQLPKLGMSRDRVRVLVIIVHRDARESTGAEWPTSRERTTVIERLSP